VRTVATVGGAALETPWYTAEQAAAYLQIESTGDKVSRLNAFYLAYQRMGIPAYRFKGGRSLRFHQSDLDAALERARVEPERDEPARTKPTLALASRARARIGEATRKGLRAPRFPREGDPPPERR
jgi:hypothetical protein